jgi:hypothetical protein
MRLRDHGEYLGSVSGVELALLLYSKNVAGKFQKRRESEVVKDAKIIGSLVSKTILGATLAMSLSVGASVDAQVFLMIDEDSIDNGTKSLENISFKTPKCGNGNPAVCVNDDIAKPAERRLLFTRGKNITPYQGLVLPTGQVGDEGLFKFTQPDPQVSVQNGATFTIPEFIDATGAAANENNLDKIHGVVPLRSADIYALKGQSVCAVVYDSDISVDVPAGFASLKGATMGLTAFEVTAVNKNPAGGSYLPLTTVNLLSSSAAQALCDSIGAVEEPLPPPA